MANVADLTQILPGKCKIHETLANPQIEKAEYPEMVDGPAESDAAYGTGSSVSDRAGSPKVTRVCYVPDSQGVSFTVDSAPIPDSAAPGVSLLPDDVSEPSVLEGPVSPDIVSEPSIPEAGAASDDAEDFFFDIHAPIRSNEDIFGPSEPESESIFEVAPDKEISSFDLYADEQNMDSSPEKK